MVDRSEPLVVTPQACPFVALEGDRDRRLDVADPMHRCFAEATPRSRSMGHQGSYCLTSAFTGCPIFLDWASRVAAEVMPAPPVGAAVAGAAGTGVISATGAEAVQRPWSTAPPWLAEATAPGDPLDISRRTARVDIDPGPGPVVVPEAGVVAEAAQADTVAATAAVAVSDPDDGTAAELAASMARTDLVGGSAADSPADGQEADPGSGEGSADTPPWSRGRARVPVDAGAPSSLAPQTRPGARPTGPREWEGARRFEAYAARGGSRRPGRPIIIAVGASLVATALLIVFLLPGMFMGGGAPASPTPAAVAAPGDVATTRPDGTPAEPEATPERPDPTPRSYRVKSGDTLLRIGRRFNVTVEQLQCANRIRNPNSLSVGKTLEIPIESYQCPQPTKKPKKTPAN